MEEMITEMVTEEMTEEVVDAAANAPEVQTEASVKGIVVKVAIAAGIVVTGLVIKNRKKIAAKIDAMKIKSLAKKGYTVVKQTEEWSEDTCEYEAPEETDAE